MTRAWKLRCIINPIMSLAVAGWLHWSHNDFMNDFWRSFVTAMLFYFALDLAIHGSPGANDEAK